MLMDLLNQDIDDILLALKMNYNDGPEDTEHANRLSWLIKFFELMKEKHEQIFRRR